MDFQLFGNTQRTGNPGPAFLPGDTTSVYLGNVCFLCFRQILWGVRDTSRSQNHGLRRMEEY